MASKDFVKTNRNSSSQVSSDDGNGVSFNATTKSDGVAGVGNAAQIVSEPGEDMASKDSVITNQDSPSDVRGFRAGVFEKLSSNGAKDVSFNATILSDGVAAVGNAVVASQIASEPGEDTIWKGNQDSSSERASAKEVSSSGAKETSFNVIIQSSGVVADNAITAQIVFQPGEAAIWKDFVMSKRDSLPERVSRAGATEMSLNAKILLNDMAVRNAVASTAQIASVPGTYDVILPKDVPMEKNVVANTNGQKNMESHHPPSLTNGQNASGDICRGMPDFESIGLTDRYVAVVYKRNKGLRCHCVHINHQQFCAIFDNRDAVFEFAYGLVFGLIDMSDRVIEGEFQVHTDPVSPVPTDPYAEEEERSDSDEKKECNCLDEDEQSTDSDVGEAPNADRDTINIVGGLDENALDILTVGYDKLYHGPGSISKLLGMNVGYNIKNAREGRYGTNCGAPELLKFLEIRWCEVDSFTWHTIPKFEHNWENFLNNVRCIHARVPT